MKTGRLSPQTGEQFRKVWRRLSWWRQEWTRAKANIEGRSLMAILSEWTPPTTRECKQMLATPMKG